MYDDKIIKRFFSKTEKQENGCIHWTGAKNGGSYGLFCFGGRQVLAHRFSYTIRNGKDSLIKGLCIAHKCDNPICVNPDHLEQITLAQNIYDCVERGRSAKGNKNQNAKLYADAVRDIRKIDESDISGIYEMALKYKITPNHVINVIRRKFWSHII